MSRRYNELVDRFTDAVFALDERFRFTFANDRAEELFERTQGNLLGQVIWDAFPETIETRFSTGLYRAMEEGVAVSFEVYHTTNETWYEARVYPGSDGLSVFMQNVTDRKDHERTLAHHAAVVDAVEDIIFVLDPANRLVAVNAAAEALLEGTPIHGEHVEVLTDSASIGDQDSIQIGRAIDDVRVGRSDTRRFDVAYVDGDGEDRMGELRLVPVDDGVATVAGVLRDVTDRYAHERVVSSLHQLTRWLVRADDPAEICSIAVHGGSDLLELPISGVWLLDETHGHLDPVAGTARAHDEFGGLPRFNQGEGLVWDVFESGELAVYDDLSTVDGLYNPNTALRSEIIAPIGTRGIFMSGAFEPDQFGETDVELIKTLVENTKTALDRAEQDRLLRERSDQLERQTERLQAVADVLSTDLKTTLDSVSDRIEDDGSLDEWEFPLAGDSASAMLDRAERLVDDVQTFAHTSTDPGARNRIDLESAFTAAVEYSRLEDASIEIDSSTTLRADPDRFGRLIEAICNDIAARAEDESVTIRVSTIDLEHHTGRGFSVLDDAGHRAQSGPDRAISTTASASPQGLGLTLVRAIADAHGWDVAIDRTKDGLTIEFTEITTLELPDDGY